MRGGLVHHTIMIPAALCLQLLQGAAVGRAPTLFQSDWFCTRISNFFQSPIFRLLASADLTALSFTPARMDFTRGNFKPKSASSILQSSILPIFRLQFTCFCVDFWNWKNRVASADWTSLAPVAGSIFKLRPLSTRSIQRFHFEKGLISKFYFITNPSNLVGKDFQ